MARVTVFLGVVLLMTLAFTVVDSKDRESCKIESEDESVPPYSDKRRQCRRCGRDFNYIKNSCIGNGFCTEDTNKRTTKKYTRMLRKCAAKSVRMEVRCDTPMMPTISSIFLADGSTCNVHKDVLSTDFDSFWDEWNDGFCNAECGGGTITKTRECMINKAEEPCKPDELVIQSGELKGQTVIVKETFEEKCNMESCPAEEEEIVWGEWAEWTDCTVPCGGGTRSKSRTCDGGSCEPDLDGNTDYVSEPCGSDPCKVDGVWGDWEQQECSDMCGEGTKTSFRRCIGPENGGEPCVCIEDSCFCEDDDDMDCKMQIHTEPCYNDACPVDECKIQPDICDVNALCTDTPTSYECLCNKGYHGNGDTCKDIDECSLNDTPCDLHADCTNSIGSYECSCKAGFDGDDGTICTDVDECSDGSHDCADNAACTNTPGGFTCKCNEGFAGNGKTCSDIQECETEADDCDENAECTNNVGTFSCACFDGYSGDGKTCEDDDECSDGTHDCGDYAQCTNTPGSFECKCNVGFYGDGKICKADGEWDEWGKWSECSLTCGGGTQFRERSCFPPVNGGLPCVTSPETDIQTTECNTDGCPVDGKWENWGSWTSCSKTCGSGTKKRSRSCIPPKNGGFNVCNSGKSQENELCNKDNCPELHTFDNVYYNYNTGKKVTLRKSAKNLKHDDYKFNDKISSVKAIGGAWQLYDNDDYDKPIIPLCPGEKRPVLGDYNDKVTSIKWIDPVPDECKEGKLMVFEDDDYKGKPKMIIKTYYNLYAIKWDNDIDSAYSYKGAWRLYEHPGYGGRYVDVCEGEEVKNFGKLTLHDGKSNNLHDKASSIKKLAKCPH